MSTNERQHWVDYAKACGITLVVYGHVSRGLVNAGIAVPERWYRLLDGVVYSFHMPLFFFLSGLFFAPSMAKWGGRKLIANKIDTVLYPFLIWSILQGLIESSLSKYTRGSVSLAAVFSLLWEPRAQFWFLYSLFSMFVVSAVVFASPKPQRDIAMLLLATCLYLFPQWLPDVAVFRYLSACWVFFCAGVVFAGRMRPEWLAGPWALALALVTFIAGQWLFHVQLGLTFAERGVASLCLALVSIGAVVSVAIALAQTSWRWIAWVGASSMAIFLMHILVGSGIRVVLQRFLHNEVWWLHLAAGCVLGMAAPLFAAALIRRWKIPYVFDAPLVAGLRAIYFGVERKHEVQR